MSPTDAVFISERRAAKADSVAAGESQPEPHSAGFLASARLSLGGALAGADGAAAMLCFIGAALSAVYVHSLDATFVRSPVPLRSALLGVFLWLYGAAWYAAVDVWRHRRAEGGDGSGTGAASPFRRFRSDYLASPRAQRALVATIALALALDTFLGLKSAIPAIQPFAWDEQLVWIDRVLHFGHHPWQLLHAMPGRAIVTRVLDAAYLFWFVVAFGTPLWMAWSNDRRLRAQFLLAYGLTWIALGVVVATLLSSAGPVYYARVVVMADPYAPLMEYLRGLDAAWPLAAVSAQETLWADYAGTTGHAFQGISAMPSLHVAIATLVALLGWRLRRGVGIALAVYAALILVGSVHLGWHYAVDGYLSVVAVPIIWWMSGAILRRYHRHLVVRE